MSKRAFSLVELAVTLAVLAVVAALALPRIGQLVLSARVAAFPDRVTSFLGQARDLARSELSCVVVQPAAAGTGCGTPDVDGMAGMTVFLATCEGVEPTPIGDQRLGFPFDSSINVGVKMATLPPADSEQPMVETPVTRLWLGPSGGTRHRGDAILSFALSDGRELRLRYHGLTGTVREIP
jgi:prepilin-type N-terminal cleavage/methylation domain-containing protein